MTGLRERKKQQTRQRISDIATGLFLERGFDAVTVAEIAEVAEVSVNTVYNYFPSKEDLFFDREEEMVDRPSRLVRERRAGESAARALLRASRADLENREGHEGPALLQEGIVDFMRCVRQSHALTARVFVMHMRTADRLTRTLREEAGAAEEDQTPSVLAVQLANLSGTVFRTFSTGFARGEPAEVMRKRALQRIDAFEALLSDDALNYATRPAE
jgi:AcrR family transcriptional regulator